MTGELPSPPHSTGWWPRPAAGTSNVPTLGHPAWLKYFYNNEIFSTIEIFLLVKNSFAVEIFSRSVPAADSAGPLERLRLSETPQSSAERRAETDQTRAVSLSHSSSLQLSPSSESQ